MTSSTDRRRRRNVLVVVTTDADAGERVAQHVGDAHVRVVAPLVRLSRLQWLANDDGQEAEAAARRAEAVARAAPDPVAEKLPTDADDVLLAIGDALHGFDADEILLVSSPEDDAGWLEEGAAWKAIGRFARPVSRLVVGAARTDSPA